jgi:uncharacterized protein YbjQ (UPF0145 family)
MLVVTTEHVAGYEIRDVLGEVHGITARSRNVYNEGVKLLTGGPNPRMSTALSRWRDEAIAQMSRLAYTRGANAVVGMRFDHRDISPTWTEICAYGTAVFVVPTKERREERREDRPGSAGTGVPARGWAPAPMATPIPTD